MALTKVKPGGIHMDMQNHDAVDGTTTWQDAVKAVKDAKP